jgi:hypothetical protein
MPYTIADFLSNYGGDIVVNARGRHGGGGGMRQTMPYATADLLSDCRGTVMSKKETKSRTTGMRPTVLYTVANLLSS